MNSRPKAYLQLHVAVLLFGLTAILGDLISLSALSLVWWRVFITSISLLIFINGGRELLKLGWPLIMRYTGVGILVALHWLTFYGAIKYSNASVVLAALATTSLFTSIIEPFITGKSVNFMEIFLGILIIPPMLLIANNIDISMQKGLYIGLLSAVLASVFACLNKRWVDKASPYEISFIEMLSATLFLSFFIPYFTKQGYSFLPSPKDWIYLIILSLACTTLAYVLAMKALKYLTAFDSNLVINMEPVYGILLAILILKEHQEMSANFYWGTVLIMIIVFVHPFINKSKYERKRKKPHILP